LASFARRTLDLTVSGVQAPECEIRKLYGELISLVVPTGTREVYKWPNQGPVKRVTWEPLFPHPDRARSAAHTFYVLDILVQEYIASLPQFDYGPYVLINELSDLGSFC